MAYQPVLVFKMLLLAYLYNLSERDVTAPDGLDPSCAIP